ncbi:probable phospholipid hydroperoxide glutathione peroxidase [Contarinia nasturtii]|uniref:probable phospholipid hydroperoxide glutathione peroxidase n=1 Tax=Contarinia nasturtii TaxID=265458 RepID=UPI0012D44283|nr:probable phospholipid hydroperoxide glutathione peroxidase [Contarinia nasturtii]XP_031632058.1 probable phospholipid hydroperoxide glutathione peroxidase [Contarinia nasturtii]
MQLLSILCICLLPKLLFSAYVSDLNSSTDCKVLLAQKDKERATNPVLANEITTTNETDYKKATSIFDFTVKDTFNVDIPLGEYCRGYVTLILNVASRCFLTDTNYAQSTQLNKKYNEKLRILVFPCNRFGGQMPETDGEEMLCHFKRWNAAPGQILAKVNVNGNSAIPLYKYLKKELKGSIGPDIEWNFVKFLIDKNGKPVKRYIEIVAPMDIVNDIEALF